MDLVQTYLKHYAKQKKQITKHPLLNDAIYIKCPE